MAVDKKITYRRNFAGGADMGTVSGGKGFSANTGLSGGYQGGPKGGTGPVGGPSGDDFRRSKQEFIKNVQKTNPGYTGGPPKNNFFKRTLNKGIGFAKRNPLQILLSAINPVFGAAMFGANILNKPEFRKRFTGYETQQEYDDARQQRINLNRINTIQNTLDTKYADGDYSMTDLDERLAGLKSQMGITPNTAAQNEQQFLDFSNQPELSYEGIESLAQPQVFNFNKIGEKLNRDMSYYSPDVGELVAELTDKQKRFIDSKKFPLQENLISPNSVYDTITNPDLGIYDTGTFGFGAQEPTTEEEYNNYLRSLGLTQTI